MNRLSPFSTAAVFAGTDTDRRIAAAAAASGGETIAPSATAAAIGSPAKRQPIQATTPVVISTAITDSIATGRQNRTADPIGKSNAASIKAGAMNRASAVSGSIRRLGEPGARATSMPPAASIAGYGRAKRRATCSNTIAASSRTTRLSKNVMLSPMEASGARS